MVPAVAPNNLAPHTKIFLLHHHVTSLCDNAFPTTILMFDEADITSWIDHIDTSIEEVRHARALPTPPRSLGSKISKQKRSASMDLDYQDDEATPRSRKRNRKGGYRPASLSEATSSIQFSQPESPARSNSPVKDLLNELRSAKPTIDYQQLDGVNLPATVRELIQKLNTDFGQAYVPLGLKVRD